MKESLLSLFFLTPLVLGAQVHQEWVSLYNGPGSAWDIATVVGVDTSGNVYITGRSDNGNLNEDIATIKYNSLGQEQWVARYNGPGDTTDASYSMVVDDEGNVYVGGFSNNEKINLDYVVIKYNSSGQQQWVVRYADPGGYDDDVKSIAIDKSGNVYVTGSCWNSTTLDDYVTFKYNSVGEEQWKARYDGPCHANDVAVKIAVDNSGNVYVTGYSQDTTSRYDYVTVKYNSEGVQQWTAQYGGPDKVLDTVKDMVVDNSGNVYVTGYTQDSVFFYEDYATVKYNSEGVQQWVALYDGPAGVSDYTRKMALDSSGNIYVTGKSMNLNNNYDWATVKYTAEGKEEWVARYNGSSNLEDVPYTIATDKTGNIYISGYVTVDTSYDMALVKYNSQGEKQWEVQFGRPGDWHDIGMNLCLDAENNVYVTGGSLGVNPTADYFTIKYSQETGISEPMKPEYDCVLDFSGSTISYSLPSSSRVCLKVYDVSGKLVKTLFSGSVEEGNHSLSWDRQVFAKGVHFVKLDTGESTITRKFVICR